MVLSFCRFLVNLVFLVSARPFCQCDREIFYFVFVSPFLCFVLFWTVSCCLLEFIYYYLKIVSLFLLLSALLLLSFTFVSKETIFLQFSRMYTVGFVRHHHDKIMVTGTMLYWSTYINVQHSVDVCILIKCNKIIQQIPRTYTFHVAGDGTVNMIWHFWSFELFHFISPKSVAVNWCLVLLRCSLLVYHLRHNSRSLTGYYYSCFSIIWIVVLVARLPATTNVAQKWAYELWAYALNWNIKGRHVYVCSICVQFVFRTKSQCHCWKDRHTEQKRIIALQKQIENGTKQKREEKTTTTDQCHLNRIHITQ